MRKILFVNDHPLSGSYDSHLACTMAEELVATGNFEVMMFGLRDDYMKPYVIPVNEFKDRWVVTSILGNSKENTIRRALRRESVESVLLVGDVDKFVWVYGIENEIRRNVPVFLYTTFNESNSHRLIKPYLSSVDHVLCGNSYTYDNCKTLTSEDGVTEFNNFIDTDVYKKSSEDLTSKKVEMFGDHKTVFMWNDVNSLDTSLANLLNLWRKVANRDSDMMLYVNTDTPINKNCNTYWMIEDLNLTNNVVVATDDDPSVEDMYNIVDCTIDISEVSKFERTVLESVHSGTPSIVINLDNYNLSHLKSVSILDTTSKYLVKNGSGYCFSNRVSDLDFIKTVFDLKRNLTRYTSNIDEDIKHISANHSRDSELIVNTLISLIDNNTDRTEYKNGMILVEEVKGE